MNPEIVFSVRHRHVFTHILLENVGGSEQNRSVIANVQSDDLWPSRMHAATHILQEKTRFFGTQCSWRTAGAYSARRSQTSWLDYEGKRGKEGEGREAERKGGRVWAVIFWLCSPCETYSMTDL